LFSAITVQPVVWAASELSNQTWADWGVAGVIAAALVIVTRWLLAAKNDTIETLRGQLKERDQTIKEKDEQLERAKDQLITGYQQIHGETVKGLMGTNELLAEELRTSRKYGARG
jgi:hypothetical protein